MSSQTCGRRQKWPLWKGKGQRNDFQFYRPVSLLPVAGMITEHVVTKQIVTYFEENKLLGSFQFGFRKSKSTVSELLTLFAELQEAKENKKEVALVMYDLSAAFDTISHDILCEKFVAYGFQEEAMRWIKSYMANRKQAVTVDGHTSSHKMVTTGCPQGSRLSPILFICLMADLDLYTEKSSLVNFADDTQSWVIADTEEECKRTTKEEANKVIDFFNANHLVNNADKAALLYNSNGVGIATEIEDIGGETLKSKESEKLLGIHISSDFTWNTHIEKLKGQLYQRIGLLSL